MRASHQLDIIWSLPEYIRHVSVFCSEYMYFPSKAPTILHMKEWGLQLLDYLSFPENNNPQQEHPALSSLYRQRPSCPPASAASRQRIPTQGLRGPPNQAWNSEAKYHTNRVTGGLSSPSLRRNLCLGYIGTGTQAQPGLLQMHTLSFFLREMGITHRRVIQCWAGYWIQLPTCVDKDINWGDLELGGFRENTPYRLDTEIFVDQLANRIT